MARIGFLHSLIRKEEKLLIEEFKNHPRASDIELMMLDDRKLIFDLHAVRQSSGEELPKLDLVLERSINHSRAIHALRLFESQGIQCVNTYQVATICGDKLLTAAALKEAEVPQPEVRVAFTEESALEACEEIGYPVVFKPAVGSWGRLISLVSDRNAAEAILEHKAILGSYHHSIFFIQDYVEKNGSDIRSFVIDGECFAAISRHSEHWKTNTARGGRVENYELGDELKDLSVRAAQAVGGGVIAVDLFETPQGLVVNEVNYTMEFRNSIAPTGVNIPGRIVDYVVGEVLGSR